MSRKLTRAAEAEEDLLSIWGFVAEQNPVAADRLLDRFEKRWRQLQDHPYSGPPREDVGSGLRHLLIGDYLTLYRVSDDVIEIIRVLHGKRDIARATRPGEEKE